MILQLSTDAEATLLACSSLGLPAAGSLRPFGPKGWSTLRMRADSAGLSVDRLVAMDAAELGRLLALDTEQSERLAGLFARRGQLAFELERLSRLGIWTTTLGDERYPDRLVERLGDHAPPVLFGIGDPTLLERDGLAVVGSRDASDEALEAAREAGKVAAERGWSLVSGAARGADTEAMRGAFDAGGVVVGVPADGLERHLRDASVRTAAAEGRVDYLSPYRPDAAFSVGAAMGRNKLIYCLARMALVVQASKGSGGTWAGAIEALEHHWVPMYVLGRGEFEEGNQELIRRGCEALAIDDISERVRNVTEVASSADPINRAPVQQTLF